MGTFRYIIKDAVGIHARPAGELVKLAKRLDSAITISKGNRTVDATRLLSVMSLGAKQGEEIVVAADSDEDLQTLRTFFEENL